MTEGRVMRAVGENEPLKVAWNTYKETADYANTLKWANVGEPYAEGSLWAAFMAGYYAGGGGQ